jgi:prepilin-type processing-associated H-X9-DG protein
MKGIRDFLRGLVTKKRIRNLLLVSIVVFSFVWFPLEVRKRAVVHAHQVESLNRLRDLSAAAMTYAASHGNRFPTTIPVLLAASPQLSPKTALSPLASDKTVPSYEMVAPAQPLQQISEPPRTPMIRSLFTTKDGKRIVAFCDGHIEIVAE